MDFRIEDITEEEIDRRLSVVEPLTDSVRQLVDAVIRSEVSDERLAAAKEKVDAIVADLREQQRPGSFGTRYTKEFIGMPWGNAAVGARNAVAPPLRIQRSPGRAECEMVLGAAYEGPGGCVHGGVAALMLDQLVGEAASTDGLPSFTGTLTVKYLRPTSLGPLSARAEVTGREGRKTFVHATMSDADGVTVEADAIMICPKDFVLPTGDALPPPADRRLDR
ncbi:PaaI family thioesterase [Gordonia alkaliphila]|uniref:PaaI family thioesterase n=1 Tax=Gordonia alkaliphila TaxID=1053547 RepID=UPI001FF16990|nr:PaaI family thioesterase [Gordonia alkaliphila]MCK0438469.1 PaaI family thioesterase [Gordonia alkaliphila]